LLRLLLLLNCKIRTNFYKERLREEPFLEEPFPSCLEKGDFKKPQSSTVQSPHHEIQSVEATGGVYKEQGRILGALMTHPYKAFLVEVQ